jgi:hypothetical protein
MKFVGDIMGKMNQDCSTALSSTQPEYSQFFLDRGLLGTTDLQTPRGYYTVTFSSSGG